MELQGALMSLLETLTKSENELISCLKMAEDPEGNTTNEKKAQLKSIEGSLSALVRDVKDLAGLDIEENSIVQFMTNMLQLEYSSIFDYVVFADSVSDPKVSETLRKFGKSEIEHAKILIKRIRAQGVFPRLVPEAKNTVAKMSVREMLEKHVELEKQSIHLCEKGLSLFQDPEFQWVFQTILADEREHLHELDDLIKTVKELDTAILVQSRYNHPHDIDLNSEEPWVDG